MNILYSFLIALASCLLLLFLWRTLREKGRGRFAAFLILMNGALLFFSINLYYAAKNEILVKDTIEKYSVQSTVDLLKLLHDPKHKVHMEDNRIYIDQGTDDERIFVFLRQPFFHILDQGQMIQLSKELPK